MRPIACALMLFWYAATAVLVIHYVFTDPQFDYRMLIIGSTVPVIGDISGGWLTALNSITIAVAALIGVMATHRVPAAFGIRSLMGHKQSVLVAIRRTRSRCI